jgi:hypothetical protein
VTKEPATAHARARAALAAAKTFQSRREAVDLAMSLGMPLSEVSEYLDTLDARQEYLDVLDARQLASREASPQPPKKSWWFGWLSQT